MNRKYIIYISVALMLGSCGMLNNGINKGKKAQSQDYYISQNGDRTPVEQKTEPTIPADTLKIQCI